jgi:cell division septation protein DedD
MTNLICPLCKHELSAGTLNTRLCDQCQTLVQTASRPASVSAAGGSRTVNVQLATASSVPGAPARRPLESNEIIEDRSASHHVSEANPFCSELFDTEDEFVETPNLESSDLTVHTTEIDLLEGAAESPTPVKDETAEDVLPADLAEHDSETVANSPSSHDVAKDIEMQYPTALAEDEGRYHELPTSDEKVSADPWEDALPPSEFSRNEWPVLVGPPRDGFIARFKTQIIVTAVLALLAGAYYLIYRQTPTRPVIDSPGPLLPSKVVEPSTSAKPSFDSAERKTPSSSATENAESKVAQQAKDMPAATTESGNAQGKFALQAAAYPTRAAADEFADKLKAAGVASYVVEVELPRRGTWYRVRVGRFNTAADAQKFATEAQLRARAAGMSLQLIVSPYEQH